jgi:hypothetical protein
MQQIHTVVVEPERWADDIEELATRVARLTRHDARRVRLALNRGAMTVESDLSAQRAESLAARLAGLGVPGRIEGPDGSRAFGPEFAEGGTDASTTSDPRADSESDSDWGSVLGEETEPLPDSPDADSSPNGQTDRASNAESHDFGAVPADDNQQPEPPEAEPEIDETEAPTSAEPADPPSTGPDAGNEPAGFDGLGMHEALGESTGSQNEEPTYSDRWEHLPPLASLLSLVAPGAGQIYNGDEERGEELIWKALLVWPWVLSVIRAWRQADAILDGKRPRPARGSLRAALGRVGLWWAAIGCLVTVGFIGSELIGGVPSDRDQKHRKETLAQADRAAALTEGRMQVQEARMRATEAAARERRESKRFTMSRAERADRLFRIGLEHCRAHDYAMCHTAMKKVATLDARYRRDAYRLQSWASLQQDPQTPDRPMPEVDVEAPSLSEYESKSIRAHEDAADAGSVGTQ